MKLIHDAKCTCCPPGDDAKMKVWSDVVGGQFQWGVEQPCAAGHIPLAADSDALKAERAKMLAVSA